MTKYEDYDNYGNVKRLVEYGDLLRYRTGSYYPDTGKMETLKQYDTGQTSAEYRITYDKYGNLATLPLCFLLINTA